MSRKFLISVAFALSSLSLHVSRPLSDCSSLLSVADDARKAGLQAVAAHRVVLYEAFCKAAGRKVDEPDAFFHTISYLIELSMIQVCRPYESALEGIRT